MAGRVPPVIIFAGSNQKFLNRQINITSESFLIVLVIFLSYITLQTVLSNSVIEFSLVN